MSSLRNNQGNKTVAMVIDNMHLCPHIHLVVTFPEFQLLILGYSPGLYSSYPPVHPGQLATLQLLTGPPGPASYSTGPLHLLTGPPGPASYSTVHPAQLATHLGYSSCHHCSESLFEIRLCLCRQEKPDNINIRNSN